MVSRLEGWHVKTSSAAAEIDDGPHGASTLYSSSTIYITFIDTHFMFACMGTQYIYNLFLDGIMFEYV